MENGQDFIDYYGLMQVSPKCDAKVLEGAYRHFAKMYHPDHRETADIDKFSQLTMAYKVLRDPDKRAEYDRSYFQRSRKTFDHFPSAMETEIDGSAALNDAEVHEKILLRLYKRRREHAHDAGIVSWLLQETIDCTDDSFEFHVWYLKSKGYIEVTEQGTLAITIHGVDHVISMSRTNFAERLLMDRSDT
jgi:curved DNA-binding protein